MTERGLDLVLIAADGSEQPIAQLRWPAELDAEARVFVRDNLIAERAGDARRAALLLARGRVEPEERVRFLAEKPFFPPEVPERLATGIDLEDLVAEFSVGLHRLRAAETSSALVLKWA